jgi:hypothetical protein
VRWASPAETWSRFQSRPNNEFETDKFYDAYAALIGVPAG